MDMGSEIWHLTAAAFVGVVLPLSLVIIRQTVKHHRQEVIQDLATVFNLPGPHESERLIPSFEFVKFKYFLPESYQSGMERRPQDFPTWAWLVSILPFSVVSGFITWFCLQLITGLPLPAFLAVASQVSSAPIWRDIVCVAFLGAYLAAIQSLAQAIHNFDLSPSLFISSTIDMVAGVALALVAVKATTALFHLPHRGDEALILLAFAIGFLPQAAQRAIISKSRLWNYKRENAAIYRHFKAVPLELIDGIDTQIRDRLSDFHIITTQNLATANPLMLFVETPYGVYQIMDWVAQAQLCSSVGPNAVAELWKFGVRTLFDLERLALDHRSQNSDLLKAVGVHLFPREIQAHSAMTFDEEAVKASIQMRLDDPYVHRLRQIYIQIGQRIGQQYWRFFVRDNRGPYSLLTVEDNVFLQA